MVVAHTTLGFLQVSTEAADLSYVRQWAASMWAAACPDGPAENGQAFVLSVHEALRNVIEHGYAGRAGLIDIEILRMPASVTVRLTHDGVPFTGAVAPPVFDGTQDSGFGIFLMTRGLSRVLYGTTPEGRQRVELIKRVRPSEPSSPHESRTS